jgi:phosphomevalonate kinase
MTGAAVRSLWAPGKVVLAGEYAVLDRGRPALVAAVDRGLSLSLRPLGEPLVVLRHGPSSESLTGDLRADVSVPVAWRGGIPGGLRFAARAVAVSLRLCAEEGRAPRGFAATFEDDLSAVDAAGRSRKLGLGGSAAASVLAVRAAALSQGRGLTPFEALALALAAHWVEQGGSGSGGDVAASSLGGVSLVRVRHLWKTPEQVLALPAKGLLADGPLEVQPVPVPADLQLVLAFSGASADTRSLVREVRAFSEARPARWRDNAEKIARRAEQLAALLEDSARDPGIAPREATLEILRRAAAAMAALGEEAGVPIATPALAEICALASSAGAAAKPSGAGGGDCAVALAFGQGAVDRLEARFASAGVACFRVGVARRLEPGAEAVEPAAGGAA